MTQALQTALERLFKKIKDRPNDDPVSDFPIFDVVQEYERAAETLTPELQVLFKDLRKAYMRAYSDTPISEVEEEIEALNKWCEAWRLR